MNLITFEYETNEDRERILSENSSNRLIAERNLPTGNFLEFQDLSQERYIKSLEDQILLMADQADGGLL